MLKQFKLISIISFSTIFISVTSYAQTCLTNTIKSSAPDSRFEIINNGSEIKDKQTGLIWQRCSLGQTWSSESLECQGRAELYNWSEALITAKALGNGYRLPNIKELTSIVEEQCYSPALNSNIFLGIPGDSYYWSSTPVIGENNSAWALSNFQGQSQPSNKDKDYEYFYNFYARAVR